MLFFSSKGSGLTAASLLNPMSPTPTDSDQGSARTNQSCPFLFPFETRQLYFNCTVFGTSRSLAAVPAGCQPGEAIRSRAVHATPTSTSSARSGTCCAAIYFADSGPVTLKHPAAHFASGTTSPKVANTATSEDREKGTRHQVRPMSTPKAFWKC
ncbi:hypothetical protein pipiens_010525 [Culex pipiens pipiens]|uniref:Uncharacterized protein n=1 Tax=Culex pipiens pipiens TaxID=38569 RepID=A0ABD1DD47_CULPP